MRTLLIALIVLVGCAPAEQFEAVEVVSSDTDAVEQEQVIEEVKACKLVLSPIAKFQSAVRVAAQRWSDSTGCDISIGEGGLPVRWDDEHEVISGKRALTHFEDGVPLYIAYKNGSTVSDNVDSLSWQVAMSSFTHELGHVLGVHEHMQSGLMCETDRTPLDKITIEVLEAVCAVQTCGVMNPEK